MSKAIPPRMYDGIEGEAYRDATLHYNDRASSPYDLAPGLMADYAIQNIQERIEANTMNRFALKSYCLSIGVVLQNPDGSFPAMAGYDSPSLTHS